MARILLHRSIREKLAGSITNPASLAGSILNKILVVVACLVAFACAQAPALAQHPGVHTGVGGHAGGGARMAAPPHVPIPPPRVVMGPRLTGPHLRGVGRDGFGFRPGTVPVFPRRVFFGRRFFRLGVGLGLNSLWWPTCGPSGAWAWGWGFNCYAPPVYGYGYENYVTVPTYESSVYQYGGYDGGGRDLVWLYLKDGAVYAVTDYWFVNGQVHFSMVEDNPRKPAEHAISQDELDVQKTAYINTHRGFRMVVRDEPWPQYLKDHPDLTPPDLAPPEEK